MRTNTMVCDWCGKTFTGRCGGPLVCKECWAAYNKADNERKAAIAKAAKEAGQ